MDQERFKDGDYRVVSTVCVCKYWNIFIQLPAHSNIISMGGVLYPHLSSPAPAPKGQPRSISTSLNYSL